MGSKSNKSSTARWRSRGPDRFRERKGKSLEHVNRCMRFLESQPLSGPYVGWVRGEGPDLIMRAGLSGSVGKVPQLICDPARGRLAHRCEEPSVCVVPLRPQDTTMIDGEISTNVFRFWIGGERIPLGTPPDDKLLAAELERAREDSRVLLCSMLDFLGEETVDQVLASPSLEFKYPGLNVANPYMP